MCKTKKKKEDGETGSFLSTKNHETFEYEYYVIGLRHYSKEDFTVFNLDDSFWCAL